MDSWKFSSSIWVEKLSKYNRSFVILYILTTSTTTESSEECSGVIIWINDGFCDDQNNNESCDFDGGDCCLPRRRTRWNRFCDVSKLCSVALVDQLYFAIFLDDKSSSLVPLFVVLPEFQLFYYSKSLK